MPTNRKPVSDATRKLVRDAQTIWHAGVAAVDSFKLVGAAVKVAGRQLHLGNHEVNLDVIRRIVVIGAGKAGAGMAQGLLTALGETLCREKSVSGWINVPDDCARNLPWIRLFPARPAGENLPTMRVFEGTQQILNLVESCEANDLCICLISGGGSALLDLPVTPITLHDQIGLINFLSAARANIKELNTVRKQISRVKGGRLGAACRSEMYTLIISDVLGDPLDVIASGPTVLDESDPQSALRILRRFDPDQTEVARSIYEVLRDPTKSQVTARELARIHNLVVGNLRDAVEAAASCARELGYETQSAVPVQLEGLADQVGKQMAQRLSELQRLAGPRAWIDGGEPVVQLADSAERGKGGRNQQVILAVAAQLFETAESHDKSFCALSGGTDGEDGPTDAAGAWFDTSSWKRARDLGLIPSHYLARNDAYHFFERLGSLLITGPTHTNVCDLRVLLSE